MKQRQAITWGRFSSDQQADGDSNKRQDRLNRDLAKREDIKIVGEHFDRGVSVKDGATPLFKKVIAALPSGVGIICENLDRINRGHPWRAKAYIADIIEAGHFIITSQDGREYNAESIETIETMMLGDMSATLARSENNKRTKRVKEAKAAAIELARLGKPSPLGKWLSPHLKYNPISNQYDLVKHKQDVIKKIFNDYANGKGVTAITKELNLSGIPTFRGKQVGAWQKSTVFTMLRYEGFIGVLNYCNERIPNAWQPAISEKLFYKVQAILTVNKSKHGNYASGNVNNILRGVTNCPHCNSAMKVITKDKYIACSGYALGKCKVKNMIKFPEMEYEFAKWFVPVAKNALLGGDETFSSIDSLTAKKDALQSKIEAMLDLVTSGIVSNEAKGRLLKLQSERDGIDNEIATVKANQVSNANLPATIKQLEGIIDGVLDNQSIRKQVAGIVPTLIKKVDIDIADKLFPSFTVHLINGANVKCEFEIIEYGINAKGKGKVLEGGYKII